MSFVHEGHLRCFGHYWLLIADPWAQKLCHDLLTSLISVIKIKRVGITSRAAPEHESISYPRLLRSNCSFSKAVLASALNYSSSQLKPVHFQFSQLVWCSNPVSQFCLRMIVQPVMAQVHFLKVLTDCWRDLLGYTT